MPSCSKCKQLVNSQAVNCPHCNNPLKAFGHPGINLYQSEDNKWLCDRCIYHQDDTCNFPQRPYAQSCTLFHDLSIPLVPKIAIPTSQKGWAGIKNWLYRYRGVVAIALLILFSVLLVLSSR